MQFQKNNTCIIFGSSPFINEIGSDKIKFLINNYTTIGINVFPYLGYNTEYWIWSDYGCYNNIKDLLYKYKVITSLEVYNREICGEVEPEYIFEGVSEIQHDFNNNLMIYKTSAHPAINYAYLKGFKNIVLCGIDLTQNWNHFYDLNGKNRPKKRIDLMRQKLYEFKRYVNLYTLNPNSDLDINKISFEDLILDI